MKRNEKPKKTPKAKQPAAAERRPVAPRKENPEAGPRKSGIVGQGGDGSI